MRPFCATVLLALVLLPAFSWSQAGAESSQAQSRYRLSTSAIAAAGAPMIGSDFLLNSTLGQSSVAGAQTAGDFILHAGFWYPLLPLTTAVDGLLLPAATQVRPNFPNPFRGGTTIPFAIASAQTVEISVYDLMGRQVKTVFKEHKHPGEYAASWTGVDEHGSRVAPGVYLCRFRAGSYGAVRKMVLVK